MKTGRQEEPAGLVDFADNQFGREADNQFGHEGEPSRLRLRSRPLFGSRVASMPRRLRRVVLAVVTLFITLCFFAACAGGLLFLRLSRGPIAVDLQAQVADALAARVRHGFRFDVGSTGVASVDGRPALVVKQLLVRDEAGRPIIKAPEAMLAVDPLHMLGGTIVPTRLEVQDVTLKLSILPDGDIALSAGTDETLPFRLSEAFESAAPSPGADRVMPVGEGLPATGFTAKADKDAFAALAKSLAPIIDKFTGGDDALGGFDRLGVKRGILVLDDRSHNSVKIFRNLDFDFARLSDGSAEMSLSADGAAGRWSATLKGARGADGHRSLGVAVQNLTLDDVRTVPALRDPGFDTDLPIDADVDIRLDEAGDLTDLKGRVDLGSGFFKLSDPDHEPVMIDKIATRFHFDAAARSLVIDPSSIDAETANYRFQGRLLPPAAPSREWTMSASGNGTVGPERPKEVPIALDKIEAAARYDLDDRRLFIDKLDLAGPQVALGLTADLQFGSTTRLRTKTTAGHMPAPVIMRLWPTVLSADVRAWLLANLQAGTVEHGTAVSDLDDADLAKIKAHRSVADNHLKIDYAVSDVTLAFMAGVPPLHGVVGTGVVTGDTSKFTVTRGLMDVAPGRQLTLPNGSLVVPTTDPKPTPAVITAHVDGPVDVLAELLARDALKSYADLPPEAEGAKGQIDGVLTVGLNLGAHARSDEATIGASAKIDGLSVDKVMGKQGLTDGNVIFVLDKTGLRAKGDANVAGARTLIDIRKPAGTAPGEANILMTLDDAARAKLGMNFGRSFTGPVTAKINKTLGTSDRKALVDLDLSKATLVNFVPGLSKAVGKPGHVTMVAMQRDDGTDLDNVVCDIGSFSARGSIDLDSSGGFQSAKMTQVRISPGDDLKVDATQVAGDNLKLVLRGPNLDARPFLKTLSDTDSPDGGGRDLDIDLHANVLTGHNSQALTGVDLKLSRRGGQFRKIQMSGKLGRAPLTITSSSQGNVLNVTIASADAGASLEFLDLYKRVSGGKLDADLHMLDGHMDGTATIHEFGLRADPALKRLTEESLSQSKNSSARIDPDNQNFTKLSVVFSKTGSKVDVKEGAMFGPEMGATVQGSIDFGRDRLALSGTFVPIYGVNNLFSQLPLLGPLLGGGEHEGLFGLNYKVNGSIGTPNLNIDPLSALAPGFLRKIFGAISDAAVEGSAPGPDRTGATPDTVAR